MNPTDPPAPTRQDRTRRRGPAAPLAVLALVLLAGAAAQAEATRPVPTLGRDGVRLRFHLGGVRDNEPELSPTLPELPGPTSAWYVAQWGKHDLLRPERMLRDDPAAADPALGRPLASFATESGESRVDIYRGVGADAVFQLSATAGQRTGAGGSNLFLAAKAPAGGTPLDRATTYRVGLKLTRARASATDPRSLGDGTVLVQVFTGFVLHFRDPATGRTTPAFLQIHHADSRGTSPRYRQCTLRNGVAELLAGGVLADPVLPFVPAARNAAPASFAFDLGRHVCALARLSFDCAGADAPQRFRFPAAAADLANWRLSSVYLGLETQIADARTGGAVAGSVESALQIANAEILQQREGHARCPAPNP